MSLGPARNRTWVFQGLLLRGIHSIRYYHSVIEEALRQYRFTAEIWSSLYFAGAQSCFGRDSIAIFLAELNLELQCPSCSVLHCSQCRRHDKDGKGSSILCSFQLVEQRLTCIESQI